MTLQEKIDEVHVRAMAIAMALGHGSTIADANDAVAGFLNELQRRGYMIVRQDYGKEAFEPDFYYDAGDWETTHDERQDAVDDLQYGEKLEVGKVAELGRLLRLPPVFLVRVPIDDGGYEIDEFETRAKAEEFALHIATPRPLLKLDKIQPGDRLVADDGFLCLSEGDVVIVVADPTREGTAALYVPCDDVRHYLDGQEDEDGHCIGFALARKELVAP